MGAHRILKLRRTSQCYQGHLLVRSLTLFPEVWTAHGMRPFYFWISSRVRISLLYKARIPSLWIPSCFLAFLLLGLHGTNLAFLLHNNASNIWKPLYLPGGFTSPRWIKPASYMWFWELFGDDLFSLPFVPVSFTWGPGLNSVFCLWFGQSRTE